jgi:hypothetical protein
MTNDEVIAIKNGVTLTCHTLVGTAAAIYTVKRKDTPEERTFNNLLAAQAYYKALLDRCSPTT